MLALLALVATLQADDAFVQERMPIPAVASGRFPDWSLYAAPVDPATIRLVLDRALEGRAGWTRTSIGWRYQQPPPQDGGRHRINALLGVVGYLNVLQGRAMRRTEAVPQRDVWTTVKLLWVPPAATALSIAFQGWVLATRPEDDAAMNVPVGEERALPSLVGLPLVTHATRFAVPRWSFVGPVSMGDALKRVAHSLQGRPGWRGEGGIPIVGEAGTYPTVWRYRPSEAQGGRPLELTVHHGRPDRQEPEPWANVEVVAQTPRLN